MATGPSPAAGPAPRATTPVHLQHVEGMRALAAYVVFVNHAYAQVWPPWLPALPPRFLSMFSYSLVAGHLSVSVFIVISGFCLTLPVCRAGGELRGGVRGFLTRRARRILPPYYGALAFCLVLIWTVIGRPTGSLWDVPIRVTPVAVAAHALLVQDLFGTGAINYVFWSIAVEWQIYFLFPLLVLSWRRYGPKATVVAAVVGGCAVRIAFLHTRVERANTHYVGLFALGMLAAYVSQSRAPEYSRARERFPWGALAAGAGAVVCALSVAWGWRAAPDHFGVLDVPVGLATMAVLVLTSRPGGSALTRAFAWRPLAFVGTFSYSVYLIHAPLLQLMWQYVLRPAHVGPLAMFALVMGLGGPAVLAVSYVFFLVFEEPFMRQSPRREPAARAVVPAAGDALGAVAAPDRGGPVS